MPLEKLFTGNAISVDLRKTIYELFGVLGNPFPGAAQTSGHPHLETEAEQPLETAIKQFIDSFNSQAWVITASQGIGKTNLLNAYESALQRELRRDGFYVIRYLADPDPSFDLLLRHIIEQLGEEHLKKLIEKFKDRKSEAQLLDNIKVNDVRCMVEKLFALSNENNDSFRKALTLAYQWLLGFRIVKAHHDLLGIYYRLDTIESKTRALSAVVIFSAELGILKGIFLLLDELEKQSSSLSQRNLVQYLSSLRALIDALPKYLFMMLAMTPDALQRYQETLPALKGRLVNTIKIQPIINKEEAQRYWKFYLDQAYKKAQHEAKDKNWEWKEKNIILLESDVNAVFNALWDKRTSEGVRQRDFLNELNRLAAEKIENKRK